MQPDRVAVAFPGQGAHNARMLDSYSKMRDFGEPYEAVCKSLGFSPLDAIERDASVVNTNSVSSLLTVLASRLAYLRFLESGEREPDFVSGYSVGQFTALHAAGCLDFEELVALVKARAELMDSCFSEEAGSMMSIIGVTPESVDNLVAALGEEGEKIWVSNYNCYGQYSLAGTKSAIKKALVLGDKLEPKRLLELPVGGAWHCPLLDRCLESFTQLLDRFEWRKPNIPVVDNVTGGFLPEEQPALKSQLVKHLTHPVKWEAGIATLIRNGCTRVVEVGHGNVLTRFGFFIDRSARYEAYSGEEMSVCAE